MMGLCVAGAFLSFIIAGAVGKAGGSTTRVLVCIACGLFIIALGLAE